MNLTANIQITWDTVPDSILLQAEIHYKSPKAEQLVCQAYQLFCQDRMETAFIDIGDAIALLKESMDSMALASHGKWKGFYDNDCLVDVKFTAYTLERIMGYIRNIGDGPHFYSWMSKYMRNKNDRAVMLITNMQNHPKDYKLYLAMKQRENQ